MLTRRDLTIVLGLATALLIPTLLTACGAAPRPRNVVLVTLDTTRADRLPAYGFAGVETPALDRLAMTGAVFEQTFAAAPLTLPSHATIFTGLYPPRHGVRDNAGQPLAAEFTTLAEVLRQRGLTTAAFVASSVVAKGRGLEQGFTDYDGASRPDCGEGQARRRADAVVDAALAWLEGHDSSPFFAWVHVYDTHRPYDLPPEYLRRYADPYLAAIAFQDAQISRLLAYLDRRRHLDDTLVVVVGDHGESLGDHGEDSHGIFVYQETLHVPFIVRGPGVAPQRVGAVTRLVDVMPTILTLVGGPLPDMDGVSLASLLKGREPDPQLDVYAESLYPQRFGWAPLRSLRADRYKVIEAPRPELYDLANDPGETRNVFAERRRLGAAMLTRLRAFDDRNGRVSPVDRAVAERIASLGYVGGGPTELPGDAADDVDPKDRIGAYNRMISIRARLHAERLRCR
jgi:arylsulfatase A-like enzyme